MEQPVDIIITGFLVSGLATFAVFIIITVFILRSMKRENRYKKRN